MQFGGQTVTAAAGVTVGAYVGNATAAIAVDGSGYVTPTAASKAGYALSATGLDLVTLPANLITAASIATGALVAVTGSTAGVPIANKGSPNKRHNTARQEIYFPPWHRSVCWPRGNFIFNN